jgi:hypothetical protein
MVEKTFCDTCGAEINEKRVFRLHIYDRNKGEEIFERDLCFKCAERFIKSE